MIAARILLAMLVIGLSQCLVHAEGVTNKSTKSVVEIVGGYTMILTNGHWRYANPAEFWRGVWKEGANGWRVQLHVYPQTNFWCDQKGRWIPGATNLMLRVEWGSPVKNSGPGYYMSPNAKFAKFQLFDSTRRVVPPNPSAGTNLPETTFSGPTMLRSIEIGPDGNAIIPKFTFRYGNHLPGWVSPRSGSMEADFPTVISTNVYPCTPNGYILGETGSSTNWVPPYISLLKLDEVYSVPKEGDYTLLVQPVLYKQNPTNKSVLNRVDLPSVATKVHLVPKAK